MLVWSFARRLARLISSGTGHVLTPASAAFLFALGAAPYTADKIACAISSCSRFLVKFIIYTKRINFRVIRGKQLLQLESVYN